MNETDARNALLVRACETAAPEQVSWSADDRAWASRGAAQIVGESASSEAFIARRARLALERLSERSRPVRRAVQASQWRPWVGWVLPAAALLGGSLTDAIGPSNRVNVLAPPLLALMGWNLLVYAGIALRALATAFGRRPRPGRAGAVLLRVGRAWRERAGDAASGVIGRFSADWARASAALNAARAARVLHLGAIAFAVGALASMYVRGLALEYRAGWESTFLDAQSVRAILGFVLGPASASSGIALPDAAHLQAMRFPESGGEPAAPWIHLYALTVALVVVVPRALLAALARHRERRLSTRFPLALDDSYFTALAREHSGQSALVVILPCNHAPGPQAALTLRAMLEAALGPRTRLAFEAPIAYGNEEAVASRLESTPSPALVVALFSASATPEPETHGRFVEGLADARPAGAALLALVDESAFVARFGGEDALSVRRRDERRLAWKRLLGAHKLQPLFVDLEHADPSAAARKLRDAIDLAARSAASATQ